jgi:predicted DNA-binding transcriptional regulator AlpA
MSIIQNETASPQDIFLKAKQVRARYGDCSHMWIERRQKDAGFPVPTFFGGLRFWRLSDLQDWDESQKDKPRTRASRGFKAFRT